MIIYIHVIFNNHYIYQLYPVIPTIKGGSLPIFITVYNITYFIWLNIVNDPELRQMYSIWSPITIYILISDIRLIYIEILYMIYIPDIIISGQNWSLLVIKSRSETDLISYYESSWKMDPRYVLKHSHTYTIEWDMVLIRVNSIFVLLPLKEVKMSFEKKISFRGVLYRKRYTSTFLGQSYVTGPPHLTRQRL